MPTAYNQSYLLAGFRIFESTYFRITHLRHPNALSIFHSQLTIISTEFETRNRSISKGLKGDEATAALFSPVLLYHLRHFRNEYEIVKFGVVALQNIVF